MIRSIGSCGRVWCALQAVAGLGPRRPRCASQWCALQAVAGLGPRRPRRASKWSTAVVLSIGLAGCAPLVDMDEPSVQGPRISHLRFVPSGTRAGCPVSARFRLETATEEIVSAKCAWVRRYGRSAWHGYRTLPVDVAAAGDHHAGEIEARFTPNDSGTYYYYVQVGDRSGRMSNVLRGTLAVDRSWTDPAPPCPAEKP